MENSKKGDKHHTFREMTLRMNACCVCNSREGEIGTCDHTGDSYHLECWKDAIREDQYLESEYDSYKDIRLEREVA